MLVCLCIKIVRLILTLQLVYMIYEGSLKFKSTTFTLRLTIRSSTIHPSTLFVGIATTIQVDGVEQSTDGILLIINWPHIGLILESLRD